jgi:hypothetical protein
LWDSTKNEIPVFMNKLRSYDESVAMQAAAVMVENRIDMNRPDLAKTLSGAPLLVRNGFRQFIKYWKMSKAANDGQQLK